MIRQFVFLASLAGACVASAAASAQVCATFDASITMTGFFTGNSCGKNLALTSFCGGGNVPNGAGNSIFQMQAGQGASQLFFQVTSTTANFYPELALIGAPCSALSECFIDDTNGTLSVGPDTFTPTAGTYFVIVSDLNADAPGCGDFTLAVSGFLPVRLQEFSVDSESKWEP